MSSLYRPIIVRYVDPLTGKRVAKGTPGATRERVKSRIYRGRFRDWDGRPADVRLCSNREAAKQMLAAHVKQAERRKAGLPSADDGEPAKLPLSAHIADWKRTLEARNRDARYVANAVMYLKTTAEACRWFFLRDLSSVDLEHYLAERRQLGLSVAGSNNYLRAAKAFGGWLVKSRPKRWQENPFTGLSKLNEQEDIRRDRRPLIADELARLIHAAASSGESFRGLLGIDRAILYRTAAYTGLRASELASLTAESLNLDGLPVVTVQARSSKRGERDELPLHPDLVLRLREWLRTRAERADDATAVLSLSGARDAKSQRLWPGHWNERAAEMLRCDLEAARQAWFDEVKDAPKEREQREQADFLKASDSTGRVVDFHSLRGTFATNLAKAGVSPKAAQQLMRHSDINLTMNTYTDLRLVDVAADVCKLGAIAGTDRQAARATGTDSLVASVVARPGDIGRNSMIQPDAPQPAESSPKPCEKHLKTREFDSACCAMKPDDSNGAAGTRTQNQQIMSLLL
jgi:integrase